MPLLIPLGAPDTRLFFICKRSDAQDDPCQSSVTSVGAWLQGISKVMNMQILWSVIQCIAGARNRVWSARKISTCDILSAGACTASLSSSIKYDVHTMPCNLHFCTILSQCMATISCTNISILHLTGSDVFLCVILWLTRCIWDSTTVSLMIL